MSWDCPVLEATLKVDASYVGMTVVYHPWYLLLSCNLDTVLKTTEGGKDFTLASFSHMEPMSFVFNLYPMDGRMGEGVGGREEK